MHGKWKHILLSELPIPDDKTGSWPKLIKAILQSEDRNVIDAMVCPESSDRIYSTTKITYFKPFPFFKYRIPLKFKYRTHFLAINRSLQECELLIISIVDSVNLKNAVWEHICERKLTRRCKLVFFHHGFHYPLTPTQWERFAGGISHMVFLTALSYHHHQQMHHALPFQASVLHNPVNSKLFFPVTAVKKISLREQLFKNSDNINFIWLSNNRPKKGLEIILKAWLIWSAGKVDVHLHVIGAHWERTYPSVTFHGKMPNEQIPPFLQAADVGIFASLCQEGFGMALLEMMASGCYCIASDVGGVKEFFRDSEDGLLVQFPNMLTAWEKAFDVAYHKHKVFSVDHEKLSRFLSLEEWVVNFSKIISDTANFYFTSSL